jgi:hypothetical protein
MMHRYSQSKLVPTPKKEEDVMKPTRENLIDANLLFYQAILTARKPTPF